MILLIDDDEFYRSVIRFTLEANAYQVIEASGGAEGVEMYRTSNPALVITDMRMPGMDGAEVIRAIREIDCRARIVAVTGAETFNNKDYLNLAEEAGADAALRKLDSTNRVLDEVGRLLEPT